MREWFVDSLWSVRCRTFISKQILPGMGPKRHSLLGRKKKCSQLQHSRCFKETMQEAVTKKPFRMKNSYLTTYINNYNELASFCSKWNQGWQYRLSAGQTQSAYCQDPRRQARWYHQSRGNKRSYRQGRSFQSGERAEMPRWFCVSPHRVISPHGLRLIWSWDWYVP